MRKQHNPRALAWVSRAVLITALASGIGSLAATSASAAVVPVGHGPNPPVVIGHLPPPQPLTCPYGFPPERCI